MRHDFKPPLLHTSHTFLRATSNRKPLHKLKAWLPPSSHMYRFPPYRSTVKCAIGCSQNMAILLAKMCCPSIFGAFLCGALLHALGFARLLYTLGIFGASTGGTLDDFASLHLHLLKVRGCTRRRTTKGALPAETYWDINIPTRKHASPASTSVLGCILISVTADTRTSSGTDRPMRRPMRALYTAYHNP